MIGFHSIWLLFHTLSLVGASISPISAKGAKLYDNDGNQFFIRGVAYAPGDDESDPLLDTTRCQTDAALMKKASINTIYVYTIDSKQDHDGCMSAFADQDIYVWLQLGDFPRATSSTQRTPQWTLSVYAAFTEVIDLFAPYPNTLAFGLGQETITANSTTTLAAPSLKAAARDLHAFQTARGYRPIPLSYSAADTASPLLPLLTAQYLACDTPSSDKSATIDLFGMNVFLACSAANWTSLHDQLASLALPVPVVISEAGCRTSDDGDRDFKDVSTVLGMRDVFGGASVFEWEMRTGEGESRYGVVEYGDDAAGSGEVKTLGQFGVLAGVFGSAASAAATGTGTGTVVESRTAAVACPTKDVGGGWLVEGDAVLPSIEGLQIGTVTVRTTVTQGVGSQATGAVQAAGGGGGGEGLSMGAVAGIAVGCGIGVLLAATAVLVCLRRRRRGGAAAGIVPKEQEGVDEPPPSYTYTYPKDKAELPEQPRAVAEMDGSSPSKRSSSMLRWKRSRRSAREDSPTVIEPSVAELPERRWRRTTQYELDENYLARMGVGAPPVPPVSAGPWQVSPMTPASTKYV